MKSCPSLFLKNLCGGAKRRYIESLILLFLMLAALPACAPQKKEKDFPLELREIIPKNWQPQRLEKINLDGDEEMEWLLLYRYTSMPGQPWGGVIYDAQVDVSPGNPWIAIPSRPAFLVPYKLLPDLNKGEGYLGEKDCDFSLHDTDEDGQNDELAIWGYTYGKECSPPTKLALFRWKDKETGYHLTKYLSGDGGIETEPERGKGAKIEKIIVRDRLHERNELCLKTVYLRQNDGSYKAEEPVLAFLTEEIPEQTFYPEEAVLAFQLKLRRGESIEPYLASKDEVSLKASDLESLKKGLITAFSYPKVFSKREITSSVYVTTILRLEDNTVREVTWQVKNTSSGKVNEDVLWEVENISEQKTPVR